MKKVLIFIHIVYICIFVCGSIFASGENTISIGGSASWRSVEHRTGIAEVRAVRPNPVLLLSSATSASISGYSAAFGVLGNFSFLTEPAMDMSVSFDERQPLLYRDITGNYRVSSSNGIETADQSLARAGTGAVIFGAGQVSIEPANRNALFSAGNRIGDFSVEFWLYPLNMENGEQILSWTAYNSSGNRNNINQRISCHASRNRLTWSFTNFFNSPNGSEYKNIEFSGNTPVIPKTWSHHLVRFDATTGMIEYLVDGNSEAIFYATPTNRESSEVFTPVIGSSGFFLLGERFSGLMDEFKIHNVFAGRSSIQKYPSSGGRIETNAIDLGDNSSGVVRVDVSGGRTGGSGISVLNEFRENGRFRFSDDSEINFFIRASDNPWLLSSSRWVTFTPGTAITGINGRYVQIAADFYPSADGETSPYLDEIRIVYIPGEPPPPPRNLTAVATDGGVQLQWRHSSIANTAGYLVYYSSVRGELFGNDSVLGSSPVDVGITNNILIGGLTNGTLYYFRVAAYDRKTGEVIYNIGEFSAEVTARPLAGLVR